MDEQRVLVLFEHEDGHFMQVMLDDAQYKALSDLISHPATNSVTDPETRWLAFLPGWTIQGSHFDGLQSIYPNLGRPPAPTD